MNYEKLALKASKTALNYKNATSTVRNSDGRSLKTLARQTSRSPRRLGRFSHPNPRTAHMAHHNPHHTHHLRTPSVFTLRMRFLSSTDEAPGNQKWKHGFLL